MSASLVAIWACRWILLGDGAEGQVRVLITLVGSRINIAGRRCGRRVTAVQFGNISVAQGVFGGDMGAWPVWIGILKALGGFELFDLHRVDRV